MRYRILGTAQAEDDQGTPVPLGGPRLRALLTALALRPGRTTTPQTLIDEIWPDDPPLDAPAALQALVARLRRTLGRTAVASAPGGYRLDAGRDSVDLFVFEDLVQRGTTALTDGDPHTAARDLRTALALWHGPALADLPDRTAAARPEALRLTATRARIEAELRLGRAPDVVPELTELTTAHPYDEPLHALLIRALRAMGRGADALAAYERARRALADGLGTDPGPELQSLHAELLSPRISPQVSPQTSAQTSAPPTAQTPGPGSPQPPAPLKPPTAPRTGNLRPRLNSFVGRELELEAIRSDLHRARLVTLTGPGGSGKTRLAEEAAAGLPQAWLAELAPLDRPEAVPAAVVSALGLRETVLITNELAMPQDDPVALLIEYCAPRSELLILDNCEHVIDAAAELAETLLTHCPGLTILATSREPLGVPGESVRPVEPLPPDPAHRLFLERAAAVRPDPHAVHDPEAVDEICRRLDGLPLAIELAAARLRLLTPRQIADRLDDRFRLLTSGSRTVLPRQQTLRAVVDWSWDLLDERERTVLREVSVFAGGWDLAAAEAVCTGPVADLIGALVDKSLVVASPGDGDGGTGMRYRMLETIHEYATERAAEAPELRAAAERRHRAWVRALVEEAEPKLRSAGQLPWIRRLETELDNIRAALYRAIAAGDEEEAGAVVLATGWFWWLRNFRREGTEWTERVLRLGAALDAGATAGSPPWSASAAAATRRPSTDVLDELAAIDHVDAFLARPAAEERHPLHSLRMRLRMLHLFFVVESRPSESMRDERTRRYTARVRAAFERGGPDAARFPGMLWALTVFHLGESYDVRHAMDAILANCRRYGGDWETGVALMFRAHMLVDSPGGLHHVDGDLTELRTLSRRVGDRWMSAQVSSAVGEAAMGRGSFEEAKGEYEEALRLAHEVGAYAESPFLLARLGEIAYREGKRADAQAALDEASDAADRYGVHDARGYVSLLRAQMALDDGETLRARALCESARVETVRNAPPPQFIAALNGIDALVTIAESGPCHGLPKLADALRHAVESGCAESVTAGLVDIAANALAALGEHARAVRLLAAADRWRLPNAVRPEPDRVEAERTEAAALKALGRARFDVERARGTEFTPDDVLGELAVASADHPVR
ncbi:AfsR family transcriptional regulator [Streptomyces sp. Y2F8-2]|uniref:BTAD domain-containing putative transcriptional regulator n=1 Tax=unclassified Streptomyces TaxID=2593676 RepID=UPI0019051686|nr:BTAD domain-containing putative transcriptional regulator [Streptomyces sp. Y2F8-2]GHK03797.1 AfsR family transcriptional regulator [Streptomyces sp. Y2F8-2]